MSRLRYNNALGSLGLPLDSVVTTINFASPPPFQTLTGSDFIPLILDPPTASINQSFEIVWLISYTAGTTVGTVMRGQESTNATPHTQGARWLCGPTAADLGVISTLTPQVVTVSSPSPTDGFVPTARTAQPGGWDWESPSVSGIGATGATGPGGLPGATGAGGITGGTGATGANTVGATGATGSSGSVSGTAGGDLSGTYPNPTVSHVLSGKTPLASVNNLSDVASVTVSRTNLGFGQPARAYRNTSQPIPPGASTKINLDTRLFDPGTSFDISLNHRWNAPAAGYYLVMWQAEIGSTTGTNAEWESLLYKSGSPYASGTDQFVTGGFGSGSSGSDIVQCSGGDYLELWAYYGGTGTKSLYMDPTTKSAFNYLSVVRIA